jgi:hypothetical protein
MTRLTLEEIVSAQDLKRAEVDMPEWGGTILVRGLGYGEWVDIRDASTVGGGQDERIFARLLISAAVVEPEITPEQAELLLAKSSSAVDRLVTEIMAASAVGAEAVRDGEARFPDTA